LKVNFIIHDIKIKFFSACIISTANCFLFNIVKYYQLKQKVESKRENFLELQLKRKVKVPQICTTFFPWKMDGDKIITTRGSKEEAQKFATSSLLSQSYFLMMKVV
jgi:hypothetical protein